MSAVAYLVVANPSSKNNLGTLIRCAAAFGVEEVVVVGASKWSTHGAHGSHKHVKYRWFGDWDSAATFLRLERGCDLCGIVQASISNKPSPSSSSSKAIVEAVAGNPLPPSAPPPTATTASITPSTATTASTTACAPPDVGDGRVGFNEKSQEEEAGKGTGHVLDGRENEERSEERSGDVGGARRDGVGTAGTAVITGCEYSYDSLAVHHRPFRRSTAFLVGHLNRLEPKALDVCDFLVHVEQAAEFVMDLGPPVTTSIALHHFTAWANYEERRFEGEKFDVDKNAARCRPPVNKEKGLTEERLRMREELRAADPLEAGGAGSGGGGGGDGDDNAEIGGGLKWLSGAGDEDVDEDADY